MTDRERIDISVAVMADYWWVEGEHHVRWVVDQVLRQLVGDGYQDWIARHEEPDADGECAEWDPGIPP